MVAKKKPKLLDNTWDNVPNPIVRATYNVFLSKEKLKNLESKRKKIELLKTQRSLSPIKGMVSCNRVPIAVATNEKKNESDIVATINVTQHGHYIEGMTTCDNGYCVHCSQTKKSKRAKKIINGITQLQNKGYTGFFVTLTMPRSNDLKKQLQLTRLGWRNIQRSLDRQNLEYETVKSYDITFSNVTGHGTYHLHIHSIFMIKSINKKLINTIIKNAWIGSVKSAELQCQDIQQIKCTKAIAEYTCKMSGLSYEIFNQSDKTTKTWKSKSLVELLELAGQNNVWAMKTYVDFIDTMKRKRTITFSRNWPKEEEEEEEEKDTVILKKLKVPLIWHRLIQNYYEDIGFLCTVGIELGGKIGNSFYETIKWYFESDSYLKIKNDILGCSDQYFYILIQDEIHEVINEYYKKYMDILKTNEYTVA